MSAPASARPRRQPNAALAVFGLLCVVVSSLVLAGERDWGWLASSYVGPVVLLGLGAVVLAATLWPGRNASPGAAEPPRAAEPAWAAPEPAAPEPAAPEPAAPESTEVAAPAGVAPPVGGDSGRSSADGDDTMTAPEDGPGPAPSEP
jgi:hypothetical protein